MFFCSYAFFIHIIYVCRVESSFGLFKNYVFEQFLPAAARSFAYCREISCLLPQSLLPTASFLKSQANAPEISYAHPSIIPYSSHESPERLSQKLLRETRGSLHIIMMEEIYKYWNDIYISIICFVLISQTEYCWQIIPMKWNNNIGVFTMKRCVCLLIVCLVICCSEARSLYRASSPDNNVCFMLDEVRQGGITSLQYCTPVRDNRVFYTI